MNRQKLLKFIPEPTNKDVIVYDTSLIDLVDKNIFQEYNNDLFEYKNLLIRSNAIQNEIEKYKNFINNVYLYETSWNEADYIKAIQDAKKVYTKMYGDINRIESNISMLKKKNEAIDERIEIQISKDKKEIQNKKENIDINISNLKQKLSQYDSKIGEKKSDLKYFLKRLDENQNEMQLLSDMQNELQSGKHTCKYCGSQVKVVSENSIIFRRILKNVEANQEEYEELNKKINKLEKDIAELEFETSKIKTELKNNLQFKKQDFNLYHKKTNEVLKLEAIKDEIINNIASEETKLKNYPQLQNDEYNKLKERILKLEKSLENLSKLKEFKTKGREQVNIKKDLDNKINKLKSNLDKYCKFISIYFKIYEKKLNDYFGINYKFKLVKFIDYDFQEILEISYKGIDYEELSPKEQKIVDEDYIQKISFFE